jgi:hypothetical protein
MDRDQMLQREIIDARNPQDVYMKTKGLDKSKIQQLADLALDVKSVPALTGLAKRNRYAVADVLEHNENASEFLAEQAARENWELLDLYYTVRDRLSQGAKRFFLSLTCKIILKSALRIAGRGIRKDLIRVADYSPGMEEFDLDQTLENFMEYGSLGTREIVGLERLERKKAGMLILDTSGSMYKEKLAIAAVTVAVLAYSMKYDDYAILLFESDTKLLKPFSREVAIEEMIEAIFALKPSGYTDIEGALREAQGEMAHVTRRDKWAVLVTDGDYNQGDDPRRAAPGFSRLNVIRIGSIRKGEETCKDLAKLGHGKYEAVTDYRNLPLALLRITR